MLPLLLPREGRGGDISSGIWEFLREIGPYLHRLGVTISLFITSSSQVWLEYTLCCQARNTFFGVILIQWIAYFLLKWSLSLFFRSLQQLIFVYTLPCTSRRKQNLNFLFAGKRFSFMRQKIVGRQYLYHHVSLLVVILPIFERQ